MRVVSFLGLCAFSTVFFGCGTAVVPCPKLKPIVPQIQKIPVCGEVRYLKTNGRVVLDEKDAACLKRKLRACEKANKQLRIALFANIKILRQTQTKGRR